MSTLEPDRAIESAAEAEDLREGVALPAGALVCVNGHEVTAGSDDDFTAADALATARAVRRSRA